MPRREMKGPSAKNVRYALALAAAANAAKRKASTKTKKAPKKYGKSQKKNIVTKVMKQMSELKIRTLANRYGDVPRPQAVGVGATPVVYYQAYCLGSPASTWTGPNGNLNTGFNPLLGYQYPNGDGADQRIGKYMYLKQCTANLRITMDSTSRTACPMRFRLIIFKAIRNAQVGTTGGNPFARLFINNQGNEVGLNTTFSQDSVGFEFMSMITNKKNFKIYKDIQFTLQNPLTTVSGSTSIVSPMAQSYPSEKFVNMTLRHNQKTAFDNNDQPTDCNYQYCVMLLSTPSGTYNASGDNGWKSHIRGTVSAYDN